MFYSVLEITSRTLGACPLSLSFSSIQQDPIITKMGLDSYKDTKINKIMYFFATYRAKSQI